MKVLFASLLLALLASCVGASGQKPHSASRAPVAAAPMPPPQQPIEVGGALLPPMPIAVTSFGAAQLEGHVYVLGGYHGTPHQYAREGQSRALWRLPLEQPGSWERIASLDAGLQGVAVVAVDESICRFGGTRAYNTEKEPMDMRSVDEAACFSPARGEWKALPPLPKARSSHEAAVIDGTVYLAGGWHLGEEGPDKAEWATDLLAIDVPHGTWRRVAAPFRRRAVGVASAGGRLVVMGGLGPDGEVSRRVDVFDPDTQEWTGGPDFPADAFGAAATGVKEAVYASARDGVVYRWKPNDEAGDKDWAAAATLAFPRFFHQLVPAGDALVALGGISGMHTHGRTRHVERVPLFKAGPLIESWTMPYPGQAKNRQAVFVHGDFVNFFGGNNSLGQHDFEPDNFVSNGWRLHLPSLQFERASDYPHRRQTMQTAATEDQGIAVGGFGHDGEQAVSHSEAYSFDFDSGQWSPRGGLPRSRTQFGLVEHDARLWAFGGLNYDPSREGAAAFEHLTSVLATPVGQFEAPFEVTGVELPGPRRAFAGAALEGRYFMVGGMRGGFELVDDCFAYTFEKRTFEPFACPRRTRLSATLLPLEGRLYLVGGSTRGPEGMQADRSIEVYDPETDTWQVVVEKLPFETRHMHALAYRGNLLLLSTHNDEGKLRAAIVALQP